MGEGIVVGVLSSVGVGLMRAGSVTSLGVGDVVAMGICVDSKRARVSSDTFDWGFFGPYQTWSRMIAPIPIMAKTMLINNKKGFFE